MKCLVIAAGKGDRLVGEVGSKPLVLLLGLSLIARVILTCRKAGIDDFYVVTGYKSKELQDFLEKLSDDRDVNITCIYNDEWEKENGLSVLKAKDLLNDNFMLTMSDHIIEVDILKHLMDEPIEDDEVVLAVDYNTGSNSLVDVDDVTKVLVDDEHITGIGKNITKYNAYDTGIFLCTPAIFSAIERSIAENSDTTLSGGIRTLAAEEKAKAFDIKDGFWIDVDDEEALLKAEKCLMKGLIKPTDGPVSRFINRPVSARITKYFLKIDITPNQISVLSFILSLLSAAFFSLGNYIALAIGAILTQLSSIVDGCDGEIARLKFKESDYGRWFDAVLDRYADAFLLFGLTIYVLKTGGELPALIIGFLAIIGSFMNSYTADKYDSLMEKILAPNKTRFRMGRDTRMFIIFIGALLNQAFGVLVIIALLMNLENIRRIIVCYKKREL